MLAVALSAGATDYYVSTAGSDSNSGLSADQAFATLGAAIGKAVRPGDNVYIAAGTYTVRDTEMMGEAAPYKLVYDFTHSGAEGRPISFVGMADADGNRPVFDFSQVKPNGFRVTAFHVKASWLTIRNVELTGVQNGATGHSQSENVRLENAVHCTIDNVAAHDGMGIGFYITRHSANNLIVNCDAYNNFDTVGGSATSGDGGNNDGFGCHVTSSADTGNMFVGCRSWNNTDDGFDLINCSAPVTIAYCFSAYSGYDASGVSRGDGNGFKCGGWGMSAKAVGVPAGGFPVHDIHDNVAYRNKANGIYSNHNLGGINVHNNTAVGSGAYNYNFVNRRGTAATDNVDVNGYGHTVVANLSYAASARRGCVGWLSVDSANCTVSGNSFHYVDGRWQDDNVAGFRSTQFSDMTHPRGADGNYSAETVSFYQTDGVAFGSDFTIYTDAVATAKATCGAMTGTGTGIIAVSRKAGKRRRHDTSAYNIAGQRLPAGGAHGIVIMDGKKTVRR